MKSHFPRWPTGSPDPIVNIIATAILVILGILAFATSFVLLVPIAIGFGVIALLRWQHNRPPPYANPALSGAVVRRTIEANFPDTDAFFSSFVRRLMEAWAPRIPLLPLLGQMAEVATRIYEMEQLTNPIPPVAVTDPIEMAKQADELQRHMQKVADAPKTLALIADTISRSFGHLRDRLPAAALRPREDIQRMADARLPALSVPLIETTPDIPHIVSEMATAFYTDDVRDLGLFRQLRAQLDRNDTAVSEGSNRYIWPSEHRGSSREIVDLYLRGTPLHDLFRADLPFPLPDEARFAGHWVLSPPGRGKTTLLHAMAMDDIGKPGACLILMDSKGDLIDPIRNLATIQDRLILIDPDPTNPVAINPLDIGRSDLAQSVDLLEYLFASLLEFKMTAMQTTLFRSVLRALVVGFPNPTLENFRDLLANGYEKYAAHIEALPLDLRDFFVHDFNERNYADRRREVLQRLRLLLDNETMRAMLTATVTRFHIGEAMDTGKIVIINNSKARLGDQGAEFFGRFFIAQVLAAAQQRSVRKPHEKPPVYFYIDECQNVIARDEKVPAILDECRSQNIALIMAHQRTKQIASENVLDALANCAIRFANSDEEARQLAPRLRTTPELLQSIGRGQFAAYVRDVTKQAAVVTVNRVDFSDHPAINAAQSRLIQERMRRDYGVPLQIEDAGPMASKTTGPEADEPPAVRGVEAPGASTPGAATGDSRTRRAAAGHDTPTHSEPPGQKPMRASRRASPKRESPAERPTSEGASDWQ